MTAGAGFATLTPSRGALTLLSPPDQVVRPARIARLSLRFDGDIRPARVQVAAQIAPDGAWRDIGSANGPDVALAWPAAWRDGATIVERLRIELAFAADAGAARLSRVVLYPGGEARTSP